MDDALDVQLNDEAAGRRDPPGDRADRGGPTMAPGELEQGVIDEVLGVHPAGT